MPDWLSQAALDAWWKMLTASPLLSLTLIIVCLAFGYAGARWRYAGKIETLEERLKLKDDTAAEYKRKLDGATPDEAKGRLDALEHLVDHLKPRELTDHQMTVLRQFLASTPGAVQVGFAMGEPTCQEYAGKIAGLYREAGWRVETVQIMAAWGPSYPGMGIIARPEDISTPMIIGLLDAFNRAGIRIKLTPNPVDAALAYRITVGPKSL